MKPRSVWVDVAKGGAISVVVFGHAWRGLYAKGLVAEDLFRGIDEAIYAFHMPLFFMISGFFFFDWVRRSPLQDQIGSVTLRLLVPLVLWTYIFLTVRLMFSDFTNARPDISSLLVLPIPGILHFWFLWALWVIQIAFLLLTALFAARLGGRTQKYAALAVAFVLWIFAPDLPFRVYLGAAYDHAVFFVGGAVVYHGLNSVRAGAGALLVAGIVFAGLTLLTQGPDPSRLAAALLAFGLSISFLVFVRSVSKLAPRAVYGLQWAGVFSFAIYMMHTIFSAGMREILLLAGVTSLGAHLSLGLLAGLLCPICVCLLATRWRFAATLGLKGHPPQRA